MNNKKILAYCPNFYKILDFEYSIGDKLSEKLVGVYQDYVFKVDINNKRQLDKLKHLDSILFKYINDYFFRKEIKTEMQRICIRKDEDVLQAIVNWIIKVYDNYEDGMTKNIYYSRWI